jgi:oxygen-independent coproporphyrinogen-3 oxidase
MCDLVFPLKELVACFGEKASDAMRQIADQIVDGDSDGLVARRSDGGFEITPAGRPFVRTIASQFDAYLNHKPVKYSVGV